RHSQHQPSAWPAYVYTTVGAPALSATSPSSGSQAASGANPMRRSDGALKVMGAAKLQDADVEASVQDLESVHEPPTADTMKLEGLPTVTSPLTETFDACVVRAAFAQLSVSPTLLDSE